MGWPYLLYMHLVNDFFLIFKNSYKDVNTKEIMEDIDENDYFILKNITDYFYKKKKLDPEIKDFCEIY